MEPPRWTAPRSATSFSTAQTGTSAEGRSSESPYFSSPYRKEVITPTDSSRITSLTVSPGPSPRNLPQYHRAATPYVPSYNEDEETVETTPQSYISRPSTSYTSRTPLPSSENYDIVCALSEARGPTPSIGVAFINATTGEAVLSQISDNRFFVRTLHKLQIMDPSCILIVTSSCPPNQKSRLYSHIEEHLVGTRIIPFAREHWSEIEGLDRIATHALREDAEAVKVALEGSFYATCAFAAAMTYLERECSLQILPHSLRVRFQPCEDTMMIDISTIISLEILQNLRRSTSKDSLIGLLDETRTPMGSRVLRTNLLQPPTVKENFIESRHDAVDELVRTPDMFMEVRKALKMFGDVEKRLTQLVIIPSKPSVAASETAMDNVLIVKAFVDAVPTLHQALIPATSSLLLKMRSLFDQELISPVRNVIYQGIYEDITLATTPLDRRNQRTFAVKSGVNGMLDVARQTYKEGNDDVMKHVEQLESQLEVSIKLRYDAKRRFFLQLRAVDFEDRPMPDVLVNRTEKRGQIECTTIRLKQLNQRISDSVAEVVMQSDKVVQGLVDSIRAQIAPLYRVCDSIAILDMIASFAQSSSTYDWVRPEISDTLALRAARHPILDKTLGAEYIPNDYYEDENHRFQVVTGCNMSGKTTYIRSIPLLQIMAQIGCFVPADAAVFPIVDSIFARVSTNDSIESNLSSFSLEMREMAFILSNVNKKSIVVIDELGRATSARDGLAIAIAMSEALIQSGAGVWFATHFTELAEVLKDRPGVLNLHLVSHVSTTVNGAPKMTMSYKVESGQVDETLYGITLAKAMDFPKRFIDVAERVSLSLRAERQRNKQSSEARKVLNRRKLIVQLHGHLKQIYQSEMDEPSMVSYLRRVREDFIERMEALENEEEQHEETRSNDFGDVDEDNDESMYDDDVFEGVDVESL